MKILHVEETQTDAKLIAVEEANKILLAVEREFPNLAGEQMFRTFQQMLRILLATGPGPLPDYIERVEDLMVRLMGKDEYEKLLSNDNHVSIIDTSKVSHLELVILKDLRLQSMPQISLIQCSPNNYPCKIYSSTPV